MWIWISAESFDFHYIGFIDGKRKYRTHSLSREQMKLLQSTGNQKVINDKTMIDSLRNGNQSMVINKSKATSKSGNKWGCRLVWSRLLASDARDPGSNPGSPTMIVLRVLQDFSFFGVCPS